MLKYIDLITF